MPQLLIGSTEILIGSAMLFLFVYFFPSIIWLILLSAIGLVFFKVVLKFM